MNDEMRLSIQHSAFSIQPLAPILPVIQIPIHAHNYKILLFRHLHHHAPLYITSLANIYFRCLRLAATALSSLFSFFFASPCQSFLPAFIVYVGISPSLRPCRCCCCMPAAWLALCLKPPLLSVGFFCLPDSFSPLPGRVDVFCLSSGCPALASLGAPPARQRPGRPICDSSHAPNAQLSSAPSSSAPLPPPPIPPRPAKKSSPFKLFALTTAGIPAVEKSCFDCLGSNQPLIPRPFPNSRPCVMATTSSWKASSSDCRRRRKSI